MIHMRLQGKFFTDPFMANNVQNAFLKFLDEFTGEKPKEFKMRLMPAGEEVTSFMWNEAVKLQTEGSYAVFCLYDYSGWRFFGRVSIRKEG